MIITMTTRLNVRSREIDLLVIRGLVLFGLFALMSVLKEEAYSRIIPTDSSIKDHPYISQGSLSSVL